MDIQMRLFQTSQNVCCEKKVHCHSDDDCVLLFVDECVHFISLPTRLKSLGQVPVLEVHATAVIGRTPPPRSIKDIWGRETSKQGRFMASGREDSINVVFKLQIFISPVIARRGCLHRLHTVLADILMICHSAACVHACAYKCAFSWAYWQCENQLAVWRTEVNRLPFILGIHVPCATLSRTEWSCSV